MARRWLVAAVVAILAVGVGVSAQEGEKKPETKEKGAHGGKGAMRGSAWLTLRALKEVMPSLSEEQKTKVEAAEREANEKIAKATEELETALGGILTAEQMQKLKEAKEAAAAKGGHEGRKAGKKQRGEEPAKEKE